MPHSLFVPGHSSNSHGAVDHAHPAFRVGQWGDCKGTEGNTIVMLTADPPSQYILLHLLLMTFNPEWTCPTKQDDQWTKIFYDSWPGPLNLQPVMCERENVSRLVLGAWWQLCGCRAGQGRAGGCGRSVARGGGTASRWLPVKETIRVGERRCWWPHFKLHQQWEVVWKHETYMLVTL